MIPKFRAFVKANTETVYGGLGYGGLGYADDCVLPVGLIDFTDREVTVWGCGRGDCGLCGDDFRLDDIVLMQSTGLKDKNGVEIYEGDITKLDEGDTYHLCVVEFNNDELCYQLTNRKTIGEYIGELVFVRGKHMAECEVVGNIHENRELLEVPNEII